MNSDTVTIKEDVFSTQELKLLGHEIHDGLNFFGPAHEIIDAESVGRHIFDPQSIAVNKHGHERKVTSFMAGHLFQLILPCVSSIAVHHEADVGRDWTNR